MIRPSVLLTAGLVLLAACVQGDPRRHADRLAAVGRLQKAELRAGEFTLLAYSRFDEPGKPVNIYIEGDGRAWLSRHRLSDDPTPRKAIGLQLAAADSGPNVAYLARPCQFSDLGKEPCDNAWWSGKRFSEPVISAMNQAIDNLTRQSGSRQLHLIGYSGGAAVAALVAARRSDVASLRTVAGNLAVDMVNRHHHVDAMPDSLDPVDVAPALADLPQVHFVGADDPVIPQTVAAAFSERAGNGPCVRIVVVEGAGHENPWAQRWPELLLRRPACD